MEIGQKFQTYMQRRVIYKGFDRNFPESVARR